MKLIKFFLSLFLGCSPLAAGADAYWEIIEGRLGLQSRIACTPVELDGRDFSTTVQFYWQLRLFALVGEEVSGVSTAPLNDQVFQNDKIRFNNDVSGTFFEFAAGPFDGLLGVLKNDQGKVIASCLIY